MRASSALLSTAKQYGFDSNKCVVSLLSYTDPVVGVATARFSVVSADFPDAVDFATSAASLFNNEAQVVPGTALIVSESRVGLRVVEAKVAKMQPTIVINESIPGNFKPVVTARNVFLDDVDNRIWSLNEADNGTKFMVRVPEVETDDDLSQLLSSLSTYGHSATHVYSEMVASMEEVSSNLSLGTFVSFVYANGDNELGCVILPRTSDNKIGVLPHGNQTSLTYIHPAVISNVLDIEAYKDHLNIPTIDASLAVATSVSVDTLLDYYRKLYGTNTEFFKKLAEKIKQHNFV